MHRIPEDLAASIYCLAMKNADEETWDFLYTKSTGNDGILNALGCSTDEKILKKYHTIANYEEN